MEKRSEIEVFYDGDCPICRFEVDLYSRMDKENRILWTDITSTALNRLPSGKTRQDLLGKFHVRDLSELQSAKTTIWYMGVDAFARIWKVLPGLRYFAFIFRIPVIRQLAQLFYIVFLKWQNWHRKTRSH